MKTKAKRCSQLFIKAKDSISGDIDITSLDFAVFYYLFATTKEWTAYVGPEIGSATFDINEQAISGTKYTGGDKRGTKYFGTFEINYSINSNVSVYGEAKMNEYDSFEQIQLQRIQS